ncbi:L-histidine N(alpha)-methyltransferase [Croceiramulus getboli]|nr:L-histidine N(alpha)-methyltransferase [Flavobacteriaceae bacterium YJPT1-3]
MKNKTTSFQEAFAEEVEAGLTAYPKYLSSKYIYDQRGDELFQQIMAMPEYYLTDCEFEILERHQSAIAQAFASERGFDLIELGAGDGKKTKILLRHFVQQGMDIHYLPVDISQNALDLLTNSLEKEMPNLSVQPQQGTYFDVLEELAQYNKRKKVIVVLGSNIGNLLHPQAITFLRKIKEAMATEDLLFMGFDQKKHPQTILDAYNDTTGITEAFNKNLLRRINLELDADFDLDAFVHWEVYDPETGTAKSYLVSTKNQLVNINALHQEIHFDAWESIHTEISQKYDDQIVSWLAKEAGLTITDQFADQRDYFKNYLFKKKAYESHLE